LDANIWDREFIVVRFNDVFNFIEYKIVAIWLFGIALLLLIISLALLIKEIQISSKALEYHLSDIEDHLKKNKS
jgi:hypothetical protein